MPSPIITGYNPTNWSSSYGGRPVTPSPTDTAGQAIAGNIANLGQLYNLAGSVNQFNTAQAALPLARNLPGYQRMIDQSSRNIGSNLRGEVPSDVVNQILQGAAERGISTGGGANANAAYLRALGLTSLGLQQTGESELTGAIARTPQAPLFNPAQFFTTPEQQQAAAMHAANVGAAPVPADAAAAQEAAALRGMQTGAGAVGGVPRINAPSMGPTTWAGGGGDQGTFVAPSLGTGTVAGGQVYDPNAFSNWNQWYGNLPAGGMTTAGTGTGQTYMGEQNAFAGMNPNDYAYAEGTPGGGYDWQSMYTDAGLPFTDWSQSGVDFSQYE